MADIIFYGGDIITVEGNHPTVEALVVHEGKIKTIGTKEECLKQKTHTTKLIDLYGRTLMPGLIESHTHPVFAATQHGWEDISGFTYRRNAEVKAAIKKRVAQSKPGELIKAFGYDPVAIPDLETLTASVLDELSPNNPIFVLNQNMHIGSANSLCLKMAGIDKFTPDPPGGEIVRDKNGDPTGLLKETGMAQVFQLLPTKSKESLVEDVRKQLQRYASQGFTTIVPMGLVEAGLSKGAYEVSPLFCLFVCLRVFN